MTNVFASKLKHLSKEHEHRQTFTVNEKTPFIIKESVRSIKANISVSLPKKEDGKAKRIFFTSALPSTGKTTVSVNVALNMAKDAKVLLIDADMRKGRVRKYFDIKKCSGLSEVLCGLASVEECLKEIDLSAVMGEKEKPLQGCGLSVLTCGGYSSSPYELMSSDSMKKLLDELSEKYDYILIDVPPVGIVSDALALAEITDGCVVVLKHMYSTRQETARMIEILKFGKCKIIGAVLNDFIGAYDHKGNYKYDYRYGYKYQAEYKYIYNYDYHYGNTGEESAEDKK